MPALLFCRWHPGPKTDKLWVARLRAPGVDGYWSQMSSNMNFRKKLKQQDKILAVFGIYVKTGGTGGESWSFFVGGEKYVKCCRNCQREREERELEESPTRKGRTKHKHHDLTFPWLTDSQRVWLASSFALTQITTTMMMMSEMLRHDTHNFFGGLWYIFLWKHFVTTVRHIMSQSVVVFHGKIKPPPNGPGPFWVEGG